MDLFEHAASPLTKIKQRTNAQIKNLRKIAKSAHPAQEAYRQIAVLEAKLYKLECASDNRSYYDKVESAIHRWP